MKSLLTGIFIFIMACRAYGFEERSNPKGIIWFDLGNVVFDTRAGLESVKYMPGFLQFAAQLKRAGYKFAAISNVDPNWGLPGDMPSKVEHLKGLIASGWVDEEKLSFGDFEPILVPRCKAELKPAASLYKLALGHANSLPSVFIGETEEEVNAAKIAGMIGIHITYSAEETRFPSIDELDRSVESLMSNRHLVESIPNKNPCAHAY